MKSYLLAIAALLILTSGSAYAFSTEQRETTNSDGTPKFADPDEQAPPFMITPNAGSGPSAFDSSGPSVTAPTVPQMLGVGRESDQDFDRAYSHVVNQNQ